MPQQKPVILCVDDEKAVLDSLWDQITPVLGHEFVCDLCQSAEEAVQLIDEYIETEQSLAVVISDMLMPGMKGDELLIHVHQKLPDTVKILLTGQTSFEAVKNAINKARLYRYISKPWEEADFILTVTEAARSFQQYLQLIEHNRILRSLNQATQEISGLMDADVLTRKLLNYVMENTGAEACYLVSERDSKYAIVSHAPAEAEEQLQAEQHDQVLQHVSQSIVNGVSQRHNLMAPIRKNGQNLGYLFLDNAVTRDPFNQNHREVVQMLASQAAISLENARLVNNLARRTKEVEEEKEKAESLLQKLVEKNKEVEEAHRVIETKSRDILDSIHYAKRIQESILPPVATLQNLLPQSFVFYQPKDIVSGDFYWWATVNDSIVIAVCDCTGHGVPGAFMSMMGVNLLNQIVNSYQILDPDVILNYLHVQMIQALNKRQQGNSNDGMDCAILHLDCATGLARFGGARRPLYLLRDDSLTEFEATRRSIADLTERPEADFAVKEIQLQAGDQLYLFTDGVVDQFGGDQHRKYSPRRLREKLCEIGGQPMELQPHLLRQSIVQWQGDYSQTDDILVVGLRYG